MVMSSQCEGFEFAIGLSLCGPDSYGGCRSMWRMHPGQRLPSKGLVLTLLWRRTIVQGTEPLSVCVVC